MHNVYRLYGLKVASNCDLPAQNLQSTSVTADVRFHISEALPGHLIRNSVKKTWYISESRDASGKADLELVELESGTFRFSYSDGSEFHINESGREVWGTCTAPSTQADLVGYFLGPILGFLLRLRNVPCLHASAISIGNRAIVFAGNSGAGKSTLAAAFLRLGYKALADDVVAIGRAEGQFIAHPGPARLKLWPHSVDILASLPSALPPLRKPADGSRLYLDLMSEGYHLQSEPQELAAIYLLSPRLSDGEIKIRPMGSSTALMALVGCTYANRLLNAQLRGAEFRQLGGIIKQVLVRQVQPVSDPRRLADLCEAIVGDTQTVLRSQPDSESHLRSA